MPPKAKKPAISAKSTKKTVPKPKDDNITETKDKVELELDEDSDYIDDEELPELVQQEHIDRTEYKPITEQKIIYVPTEQRICSEVMTKFEYARVLAIRAKQLEDSNIAYTDVKDITDPIKMAQKEIADKMCPLAIIRVRTADGHTIIAEKWKVNELAIPAETLSS
jgi:DNA-directed RNA polymerase subunit K/omega